MAQLTGGSENSPSARAIVIFFGHATPTSKATPAKLAKRMSGRWRVVLLRAKGEILGTVEAPDAQAAKVAAASRSVHSTSRVPRDVRPHIGSSIQARSSSSCAGVGELSASETEDGGR